MKQKTRALQKYKYVLGLEAPPPKPDKTVVHVYPKELGIQNLYIAHCAIKLVLGVVS